MGKIFQSRIREAVIQSLTEEEISYILSSYSPPSGWSVVWMGNSYDRFSDTASGLYARSKMLAAISEFKLQRARFWRSVEETDAPADSAKWLKAIVE